VDEDEDADKDEQLAKRGRRNRRSSKAKQLRQTAKTKRQCQLDSTRLNSTPEEGKHLRTRRGWRATPVCRHQDDEHREDEQQGRAFIQIDLGALLLRLPPLDCSKGIHFNAGLSPQPGNICRQSLAWKTCKTDTGWGGIGVGAGVGCRIQSQGESITGACGAPRCGCPLLPAPHLADLNGQSAIQKHNTNSQRGCSWRCKE